jgi:hypothetical protein
LCAWVTVLRYLLISSCNYGGREDRKVFLRCFCSVTTKVSHNARGNEMDETKYVSGWHHVPFINLQLRTRVLVIVSILAVATFYSSREAFSLNESSLETYCWRCTSSSYHVTSIYSGCCPHQFYIVQHLPSIMCTERLTTWSRLRARHTQHHASLLYEGSAQTDRSKRLNLRSDHPLQINFIPLDHVFTIHNILYVTMTSNQNQFNLISEVTNCES